MTIPQNLLRSVFEAAVAAADPLWRVAGFLPKRPGAGKGRTIVVGAGKAAAAMALAVERSWLGGADTQSPEDLTGLVVTRYGHGMETSRIRVVEASHPVPDAAGQAAAEEILSAVSGLTENDLVLCLISGGGSALLALPAPGITLGEKQEIGRRLLKSGASIKEFNCVRKHLSAIKGGKLAQAAAPARVVTLLISDVPGDDPSVIASGPTVPDPSTRGDALAVLEKYGVPLSPGVEAWLQSEESETPKPGAPFFSRNEVHLIATPHQGLIAAAKVAESRDIHTIILGDAIEGEARDVAKDHADIVKRIAAWGDTSLVLSGGETSVTVRGNGRGGRNAEFLLALAIALDGHPGIHALACDTDGIDGVEDNAGAIISPDTLARARAMGLDAHAELANNNASAFFEKLGDLVVTGPTHTNINDFRAIWIR